MIDYKKLAEALGVELGDAFYPVRGYGKYKITEYGIMYHRDSQWQKCVPKHDADYDFSNYYAVTLGKVLTGTTELRFCVANLSDGDKYWSYSGNDWTVTEYTWCSSMEDVSRKNMGATFRKRYHALHNRPAVYEKTTGKEWTNG